MGKIPNELREVIAKNIRACRMKRFPGRGGAKKCAAAFGVSPQQWSPWERGMRTPDELRLRQIAAFFEVTVEDLRRDNEPAPTQNNEEQPLNEETPRPPAPDKPLSSYPYPLPGMPPIDPPGSPASFYWLLRYIVQQVLTDGVKVTLDEESIARIVRRCQERS